MTITYEIWDNHSGSTPVSVTLTHDMGANHDPVISDTQCYNIDEQTIVWRDISRDEDCTGNDSCPGWLGVLWPNAANAFYKRPLTNVDSSFEFAHVYDPSKNEIATVDGTACNPNNPDTVCQSWVSYKLADNSRDSFFNLQAGKPGGWAMLKDHYTWRACDYTNNASKDPNYPYYNKLPRMKWTLSQGPKNADGSQAVILTDLSVDPDYNNPTKRAYWGAGHGATEKAIIRITWQRPGENLPNEHIKEEHDVLLTDKAVPHSFSHTFPADMVAWGSVWLYYEIIDNHARQADVGQNRNKPWYSHSGWLNYTFSK